MRPAILAAVIAWLAWGCAPTATHLRGGIHGEDLVRVATKQVGVNYRYGGNGPDEGFDCSGLVHYCFKQLGVVVPRSTKTLYQEGHRVPKGSLQPGDLVFFKFSGSGPAHVGIYAGGDKMVHAPSTGSKVREDYIASKFWLKRFIGARRLD